MKPAKMKPPAPRAAFLRKVASQAVFAIGLLLPSLLAGMSGYMHFEKLSATDAFLNTAMLLGGMGPVNAPVTEGGKIFAGFFALYAGLVVVLVAALLLTPVAHRILHVFHWNMREDE